MEQRGKAVDRHGRVWNAKVVRRSEAAEEDFRFWYEELTPEQRVEAVEECLLSALKARGIDEIPRLRRVSRIIRRPVSTKRSVGRDQDRADPEHPERPG